MSRQDECGKFVLAQGDYLSIAGPIDKKSVRAHSHGNEIGALAEGESVSDSQDSEQTDSRSKSETDLATSKAAVKGALDPNDPRFVEKEVRSLLCLKICSNVSREHNPLQQGSQPQQTLQLPSA